MWRKTELPKESTPTGGPVTFLMIVWFQSLVKVLIRATSFSKTIKMFISLTSKEPFSVLFLVFHALFVFASGFVYDMTGDFNNSFYFGAALGFLGGCLALVIVVRVHCVTNGAANSPHKRPGDETAHNDNIHLQTLPSDEVDSFFKTPAQITLK